MPTLPLLALLSACAGWNRLPDRHDVSLDVPLWDPASAIPTEDGLVLRLPSSGGIALVKASGQARKIDVGEGRVRTLTAAPDGRTVVAFIDRFRCAPDDPDDRGEATRVEDCDPSETAVTSEMAILRGGTLQGKPIALDGVYNALAYADDGRFAVVYLDLSREDLDISGVVSLTSVIVLDLETGDSHPVSVGFAAEQVLFVEGAAGDAEKAVILSRNAVAVVDLLASPPRREVTFPLTLDPDMTVEPVGVALTPDGQNALVSVSGSADLYALDLVNQSINIVELSALPSAMQVDASTDRTVFVYNGTPRVDLLEHQFFDVTSIDLDEGMNEIAMATGVAVLWSSAQRHDLYRLDLGAEELVEYRLENPAVSVHVAPTEEFAIALTRAEDGFNDGVEGLYDRSPGMEIIDLSDDDTTPFVLDGQGLGVAWSEAEGRLDAIVLQDRVDYLYMLDLYTGRSQKVELSAAPVAIGTLPDGTFYVTHADALGLVSFLDPETLKVTEAGGFATLGIVDPIELIDTENN